MLPNIVTTHYGVNGTPSYGEKSALLIIPVAYTAVFVLLLLILRYRYTLLEKYPYLINLPSFVYRLGREKNIDLRSRVMQKVFTVYSLAFFYVSLLFGTITYFIFQLPGSSSAFRLLPLFAIIIALVASVLLLYRRIYRSFAKKAR